MKICQQVGEFASISHPLPHDIKWIIIIIMIIIIVIIIIISMIRQ